MLPGSTETFECYKLTTAAAAGHEALPPYTSTSCLRPLPGQRKNAQTPVPPPPGRRRDIVQHGVVHAGGPAGHRHRCTCALQHCGRARLDVSPGLRAPSQAQAEAQVQTGLTLWLVRMHRAHSADAVQAQARAQVQMRYLQLVSPSGWWCPRGRARSLSWRPGRCGC